MACTGSTGQEAGKINVHKSERSITEMGGRGGEGGGGRDDKGCDKDKYWEKKSKRKICIVLLS